VVAVARVSVDDDLIWFLIAVLLVTTGIAIGMLVL
jgi:hypothetical protein